jgi:hypothetical protein
MTMSRSHHFYQQETGNEFSKFHRSQGDSSRRRRSRRSDDLDLSRLSAHAHHAQDHYHIIPRLSRCESTPTHPILPFLQTFYTHYYELHTTYHDSITNIPKRHPSNYVEPITHKKRQVDNFIIFTSTLFTSLFVFSACYCVVLNRQVALPRIYGICRVVITSITCSNDKRF